jgi:hypothetical protein
MYLSPDPACDENTRVNVAASEEATRTAAFNRFIILFLSFVLSVFGGSRFQFFIRTEPLLTLFDSALRPDAAQSLPGNASKIL